MDRDPLSVNYPGLRTQERNEISEEFEDLALKDKKRIEHNRKRVNGQFVEKDDLREMRDSGVIENNVADYGGSWFRKYKTGVNKLDDKNDAFKTQ
jgi:hypothetical protein